jgi:molybdopterin-guanine dinucleotide biosynthesis protein A
MGRPKATLAFGSECLLQRVVRLVATMADPIVVVPAPGQRLPRLPDFVAVAEDAVRGRGPLQGLAAGMATFPDDVELVYATATDVPFLKSAWISRLVALAPGNDLVIPYVEEHYHPLAAVYRRAPALAAIRTLLRDDRLRLIFLTEILATRTVMAGDLKDVDPEFSTLRNLNTPEEYRAALAEAGLTEVQPESPLSCSFHEAGLTEVQPETPLSCRIHVELFGVPRRRAGVGHLEVEGRTMREALRALARACPALVGSILNAEGAVQPAAIVSLNGNRFTNEPTTPLVDGDTLILLDVECGG